MGAMRKMAVYLGLVEDEAYDYTEQNGYYEPAARREEPRYSAVREEPRYSAVREEPRYSAVREVRPDRGSTRTMEAPARTARVSAPEASLSPALDDPYEDAPGVSDFYRITTLHPRTYNDARRIGEEFREGIPVIMNLTDMDDVDAKRLVDFAAGLVFGCRGTIERVTNKVFLLSPTNVDVAAEARRLAQDGFFNQS